jgi:hypothetical protein
MGIMKVCTKCIALCLFGTRASTASTVVVSRNKTAKWFALMFLVNDTDPSYVLKSFPLKLVNVCKRDF